MTVFMEWKLFLSILLTSLSLRNAHMSGTTSVKTVDITDYITQFSDFDKVQSIEARKVVIYLSTEV